MITLHRSCSTRAPPTGKIQVIGTLSSNMALTDMFLQSELALWRGIDVEAYVESLRRVAALIAFIPLAWQIVISDILLSCGLRSCRSSRGSWSLLVLARHFDRY
jgi:hypothetical protein